MSAEWSRVLLGDVVSEVTVGFVGPMASEYVDAGIPFLRSQNVLPFRLDFKNVKYISPEFHSKLKKSALRPGDVVTVRTGKPGSTAVIPESLSVANCSDLVITRPGNAVDSRWLSYYINGAAAGFVSSRLVGAVQQHFNVSAAKEMDLLLPPLDEQRAIAATLGSLDDKIESNRQIAARTSALIDAIAEQIVTTSDLRNRSLSDVVEFNRVSVKPHSTELLHYIDIASVSPGRVDSIVELEWSDAPSRARRGVSDGDVIFSTVRPDRRSFALMLDPSQCAVVSTGFAVMTPTNSLGSSMLTSIVGSSAFAEYLASVAQGSTYPAVSNQAMGKFEIALPRDPEALAAFEMLTMPMRRRAAQAEVEIRRLESLRDVLLPELLSGRIRVPIEEVVAV